MIWNLGSINIDNFYHLAHLPGPGETLAAQRLETGLGGKGANMSVAAARAAGRVTHIGAVGPEGGWARDRLLEYGVDVQHIHRLTVPTGHANINVDAQGENSITLFAGANRAVTDEMIGGALADASPGDFLLMQNETGGQVFAARTARTLGLRVAYAAAPFDVATVEAVLAYTDLLILNEVEAEQLREATGHDLRDLPVADIVVTLGAAGCDWLRSGKTQHFDAYPAKAIDTTGAGDTFTGYLVAALDRGFDMARAVDLAMRAGALMVTRRGTADVIPDLKDIQDHDFSQ